MARYNFPLPAICARCGTAPAVDRHHVDGDATNNVSENIMGVCRRCHMEIDGRISQRRGHRKTQCKNGHAFTPENTYITPRGAQCCRTCRREAERRYDLKRRAAV